MRVVWLLVGKDLRSIIRTRLLLIALIIYPLVIAALVGAVLLSSNKSTSIAFVNLDTSGKTLSVGGKKFGVEQYEQQARDSGVNIKKMNEPEAMRALDDGQVAGVFVIPEGFMARLRTTIAPSSIEFRTGNNALGDAVTQRVRGVIYRVNLKISDALIKENKGYLQQLADGGSVSVLNRTYELYGLEKTQTSLEKVKPELDKQESIDTVDEIIKFARRAQAALGIADNALDAAAAPIRLQHMRTKGKSPQLTAKALSFALAVSLAFICVLLVSASLAAERDERVLGRLLHGAARGWQVVVAKLVSGAVLGLTFSLGLFVVFAILAPQAWARLPLLAVCVLVSAASFGSIGTLLACLARDARTATLVGILLVLPLVPLGLLPGKGLAYYASALMPFAPSYRTFNAALFDSHPWHGVAVGLANLLVIGIVACAATLKLLRRLA
ncbi:MAG: ABC transporter permease [Thermoleophilia bacterium]|nr:ABC transporter permease [Thermoleophilia bacterium]